MLFIEKTLNLVQYVGLNITYNTLVIQIVAQWDIHNEIFLQKPLRNDMYVFLGTNAIALNSE